MTTPLSNYEHVKRWRAKNKDKVRAQERRRAIKRKDHVRAQQKAWRDRNIEHVRKMDAENHRKARKADPEGYRRRSRAFAQRRRARLEIEAGRPAPELCEVCGECHIRIVYDHCHASGNFRGWICDRCNRVLGLMKDNPELLRRLAAYLENPHGETYDEAEKGPAGLRVCWAG